MIRAKTDCFAYNARSGKCTATTYSDCEICNFYKTAEEYAKPIICSRSKAIVDYYAKALDKKTGGSK